MTGRANNTSSDRCPGCRAPIIRTLWLGLRITADTRPLNPTQQQAVWDDPAGDRLVWCLRQAAYTPARLTEINRNSHPADCPRPHIACHQCPPADPTTLF